MNITINGQKKSSAAPDLQTLLDGEGYKGKIIAVARNGEFVPRASYTNINLKDGDEIEIVAPMQGG
jgi:sulfur carrier protein